MLPYTLPKYVLYKVGELIGVGNPSARVVQVQVRMRLVPRAQLYVLSSPPYIGYLRYADKKEGENISRKCNRTQGLRLKSVPSIARHGEGHGD